MVDFDTERFETLRTSFSGELLHSADPGYDARRIHNGLIDRRPALIARCLGAVDVADAVRFARDSGLEICVRGGGHNVAGRAVVDDALMIDLSLMKGVHVDPEARTVRAQSGLVWREFNRETAAHGLAVTGGAISTTGIAGLTLGGGLGWLMAKYGLAATTCSPYSSSRPTVRSSTSPPTRIQISSGRYRAAEATSASRPRSSTGSIPSG